MSADSPAAVPSPAGSSAGSSSGDAPLALSVQHMDVTYRVRGQDRLALRDVSFSIERGESYGLVGESGSGKSTAALALVRYLPSNGRVSNGSIRCQWARPPCGTCGPAPSRWCTRSPGKH
jgi:ABC-type glutathione transport system ATPase component